MKKQMKNVTKNLSIATMCLLVAGFFASCESLKIPKAPFIVVKMEIINSGASYKYYIESLENRERGEEFLSNELFMVGDTLYLGKKTCH